MEGIHRCITTTFVLILMVAMFFIGTTSGATPWCTIPVQCKNSTHFQLCMGYEKGYTYLWDRPIPCLSGSFCNISRCQEMYLQPPFIAGTKQCNEHGFTCSNANEFRICKYDKFNYSAPMSWDFHCPQNTICDVNYKYFCRDVGSTPGHIPNVQPPPPGFHLPPLQNPVQQMPPAQPQVIRDDCKGKGFVCTDSKTYLLCRYMGDGTIRPDPEKFKCPKKHVCHKSYDKPCVSGAMSTGINHGFTWGVLATVLIVFFQTA